MKNSPPPPALVMNLFYTGLGIARCLGRRGIPVIGLTSQTGLYGNYTRYARIELCPDSRKHPDALLEFLLKLAEQIGCRAVIFPTRDDDVVFLDRFRGELAPHYQLVVPSGPAVASCLDKWKTYLAAKEAAVPVPECWIIQSEQDLERAIDGISYPCVLKPLAAYHWRQGRNWDIVGARKAIPVGSVQELRAAHAEVAQADVRMLVQELISGGDDCLVVTACYINRNSNCAAVFYAQKVLQEPVGFGTGCVVKSSHHPELLAPTLRLLEHIHFTGIAEVEYKWDSATKTYKLIEVNPRPWDQHILGGATGVDLIALAYYDHASLPLPSIHKRDASYKWVADDTFVTTALRSVGKKGRLPALFRAAQGKRVYAIWSAKDPMPFFVRFVRGLLPDLAKACLVRLQSILNARLARHSFSAKGNS